MDASLQAPSPAIISRRIRIYLPIQPQLNHVMMIDGGVDIVHVVAGIRPR